MESVSFPTMKGKREFWKGRRDGGERPTFFVPVMPPLEEEEEE